jgi:hypothetical protein
VREHALGLAKHVAGHLEYMASRSA